MQRLHVVGFTQDNEGLILSARRGTKTGGWTVVVDAEFEEALAGLLKERGGEAESRIPRAESQLSVREMQQRLRAGQSIKQVARAAGVHDEWVERFAIPIQAEQQQVVRQALDMIMSKPRNAGTSTQPLGMSVWWNLLDRLANLPSDGWDSGWSAFLVRENCWVVRFAYEARKRQQQAEWEVDFKAGTITSRNRLATELGYVEPGRRRRPGPPPPIAGGLLSRPAPPVAEESAPAPEPVVEVAVTRKKTPTKKATAAKRPAKKPATRQTLAAKKLPATRKKVAVKPAPLPAPRRAMRRR
ncbi:MAG TPA: septation protein SepH [Acidimicrobiales bacterium]|nr:septation protein SepH [Acidimicrobiales bacterium]